jgi:arabinofuranan 3-O-arabinosyltransferase
MRGLATVPLWYIVVGAVGVIMWGKAAGLAFEAFMADGIPAGFADKDFANYWTAARLVLEGRTADLFGPHAGYFAHLTAAFGADYPWHNWSYPPHFLLFIWPLGYLGYEPAMLLFLGVTGAFFARAAHRFAGNAGALLWLAVMPFVAHNFWVAQNGFMFAGLGLAALALRSERPIMAGVLLGMLTVKPQLGLLFPLLLLIERRWTVIASASVMTLALVGLSGAVFGIDAWRGYLQEVVPYQTFVMRELEGTFLAMLPSVYGMLRNWGFGADAALAVHAAFAAVAFVVTVAALLLARSDRDRSILLLIAIFLITPYALTYDLGLVMPAIALLALRLPASNRAASLWLCLAMVLPVVMMQIGNLKVSIAPLVFAGVFGIALDRLGIVGRARAYARILRRGRSRLSPLAA